jgi:glyoxylase-like metal-dependent hydrolase (beta-lactamase superfamily II)
MDAEGTVGVSVGAGVGMSVGMCIESPTLRSSHVNPNERELHYPWTTPPAPGAVVPLRPGLHWLRMPLPFALNHINLWLLDDEIDGAPGFTTIDSGIASDDTRAAWEAVFDGAFGGLPLVRHLVTHFHPDHLGLADWLVQGGAKHRWRTELWMSMTEYLFGRVLSQADDAVSAERGARSAAHFAVEADRLTALVRRETGYFRSLVPSVPGSFRRLMHDDELAIGRAGHRRVFRVIVGHGHAPEHVSLYCEAERLLVSGDMVLPRISTNVSVFEHEPEADPLRLYLRSLDRYLQLPEDTLVLPSHGLPFTGLHRRVAQQHAHHAERLQVVREACRTPKCAAEIVPVLFDREFDLHQLTFALGEAIAHLHLLWHDGSLTRTLGDDGVLRFTAA